MKKVKEIVSILSCVSVVGCGLCACSQNKTELLAKPPEVTRLTYKDWGSDSFKEILASADDFAAKFSGAAYSAYGENADKNIAVSPVSVYMALSLAARCTDGETREEILSALGVSYDFLVDELKTLYRSLNEVYESVTGDAAGILELGNSIWLDSAAKANDDCLTSLANDSYCYSYSADFANDNEGANLAVRQFVRERTHGLIDRDMNIPASTVFALMNTLYLKDVWRFDGSDIAVTDEEIDFTCDNGKTISKQFIDTSYLNGRAYTSQNGDYTSFHTETYNGYRINFMLPADGCDIDDVFTADNIKEMNGVKDYGAVDRENKIYYHTKCVFPMFEANFDEDVCDVLRNDFDIKKMFDPSQADYSPITEEKGIFCSSVPHITKLEVNRKGIEGAAVTIEIAAGAAGPNEEYTDVYETFTVDKAFGFTVRDNFGTTLFSGVIKNI